VIRAKILGTQMNADETQMNAGKRLDDIPGMPFIAAASLLRIALLRSSAFHLRSSAFHV
jgi:hypothetical protein